MFEWKPYVRVADRRAKAAKEMGRRAKAGLVVEPVTIVGRVIAKSFWGKRWCDAMESLRDYANRLERGRTYARNGSVVHLAIREGEVKAVVSGSALYEVSARIKTLPKPRWDEIRAACRGKVGSAVDLLMGKLSDEVLEVLTDEKTGLFPRAGEITLRCSCPDGAYLCKHLAAVLYGVGARLDAKPELLFVLRGVDPSELFDAGAALSLDAQGADTIAADDLSSIFGIDLGDATPSAPATKTRTTAKPAVPKPAAAKPAVPKPAVAKPAAPKPAATRPRAAAKKAPATSPVDDTFDMDTLRMFLTPAQVKKKLGDGSLYAVGPDRYRFRT